MPRDKILERMGLDHPQICRDEGRLSVMPNSKRLVLADLANHPESTAHEIYARNPQAWLHVGSIRPRLHELEALGLIELKGRRRDGTTRVSNSTWALTTKGEQACLTTCLKS